MDDSPLVQVIEDDDDARTAIVELLQSAGLDAQGFATPRQFLARFEPQRVGCLVVDLRLPETSGLDLCRRLAGAGYCPPFIVVTGYGEVRLAVEALHQGALDFLEKPFSSQRLIDRVNEAIVRDRSNRRRAAQRAVVQSRLDQLTPRERQVLDRVLTGQMTKQIARELDISLKTVEVHRSKIKRKMQVESVAQLILLMVPVLSDSSTFESPESP